jgi:hypothetical protein
MNLLVSSTHPADAGLQSALVELLADFGAAVNGLRDDESPLLTALDFGTSPRRGTVRRGARVDNVITAAVDGPARPRQRFVIDKDTLAGVPMNRTRLQKVPNEPKLHIIEPALVWGVGKFARTRGGPSVSSPLGVRSAGRLDGVEMTHDCMRRRQTGVVDLVKDLLAARRLVGGL